MMFKKTAALTKTFDTNNSQKKRKNFFRDKLIKDLPPDGLEQVYDKLKENRRKEFGYQEKDQNKNNNSSTLSLHITAYENSTESIADDLKNGVENSVIKKNKEEKKLIKKWKNTTNFFSESAIKAVFEFPRQQERDKLDNPEVMQFKTSQRLLNSNEAPPSENMSKVLCQQCNKSFTKRGFPSHVRHKHPSKPEGNADSKPATITTAAAAASAKSNIPDKNFHWLDISTEDGTVISCNVTPTGGRATGFYKHDKISGKFVETEYNEAAEWFRVSCKYCGETQTRLTLRKHYVEAHLQANKEKFVVPNIFNIQSTSFAGILPSSDSWPIDFSLMVQDDPLLKYDKVLYTSYFTTDSNFKSSNELLKFFKYSMNPEHFQHSYLFYFICPKCEEKISCVSLNIMKLVVLVHLRVQHRDNGLLVKMCEEEIKYFNKAFGTNFTLFVELGNGPRLPSDLLLTGPEADFIRENAYGDYDVTGRYYPCKLCLTYFFNDIAFKRHLSQVHSFVTVSVGYYDVVFVKPHQIVTDPVILKLNSSYPLSFSKIGNEYTWCCHLCGLLLKDCQIGYLFARIGAHILSKKLSYENISKSYVFLTQCTKFSQMKIYHQTLQWNCLQYQRIFQSISGEAETVERKCSFCSKSFILPKLLSNEAAEILHILLEHDNIASDDLLLRYLINSEAGEKFPFVDVLFGDILEKKANERRLRCSKCSTIFKSCTDLLLHGRFHLSQHRIDPARYFFALPSTSLNTILAHLINGVTSDDKFSEYDYTIYVCTTCLQIMNPNGNINHVQMVEHIKSCHFKEPSIPIDELPTALKESNFRIYIFSSSPCSSCGKQYITSAAAKQCCIAGQPLPIFTEKRTAANKGTLVEVNGSKRKCDVKNFVFNTFSF